MNDALQRLRYECCFVFISLAFLGTSAASIAIADDTTGPGGIADEAAGLGAASIAWLENVDVTESSGLAFSNLANDRLWTHNDSGDTARLFAFDRNGKTTGGCELKGVDAVDFEDMASFTQDSVARIVVADVGDNRSARSFVSLYFFDEPPPDQQTSVTHWTRVDIRYPDGPRDCEAIAVDPQRGIVTLITKSFLPAASVYELPLPQRLPSGAASPTEIQTLKRVVALQIPLVTGVDRDPVSGDYIVINYFQMFRFPVGDTDKSWWQSPPKAADLPRLKQIEAVAVDRSGDVWVTAEASPTPLAKVKGLQK